MTEQLLAREAGLALPGWVTRERLSDSSLVPSGRQAPASPLCGHSAPLGSHRRTLSCLLLSGVEGLSRRQAVGGRGVAGEAPGQTAGLAPRRGRPWGRRHPRAQRQRSIRSLPSPLQPRNSLSEAPRDTAQNATVGGSLGSSSRRPQGALRAFSPATPHPGRKRLPEQASLFHARRCPSGGGASAGRLL